MKLFRYIFLAFLPIGSLPLQAHADDEQEQNSVYDATTTSFIQQPNIQYNLGEYKTISDDQAIQKLHRFTFVQRQGHLFQDLAGYGTAVKPIFYTLPEQIGLTSGFHAYDPYFRTPDEVRYYDTRSPYTRVNVNLAHFFKDFTNNYADLCYSQNITPHWNVGGAFRMIGTGKGRLAWRASNSRNVRFDELCIFTHYKTEENTYQLLAHGLTGRNRVYETGGAAWKQGCKEEDILANPAEIHARLNNEQNSDERKRLHLYHQLEVAEQLWGYHEAGIQKQHNTTGLPPTAPNDYYTTWARPTEDNSTTTTTWNTYTEAGGKGYWNDLFCNGYYQYKHVALQSTNPPSGVQNRDEHYVGFRTRYPLNGPDGLLHVQGNYLIHNGLNLFPGLYKMRLSYEGQRLDAAFEQVSYQPSALAQTYSQEQLLPTTATRVKGGMSLELGEAYLKPKLSFTALEKHIYFKNNSKRLEDLSKHKLIQDDQYVYLLMEEGDFRLPLGRHWHWDGELVLAQVLGPSASILHVPDWLLNTRLYYARSNEKNNGTVEAGVDMHCKSSYYADAYDPNIQQFYLQDTFNVYSYPILDLFVNFRIQHFSMFLKFSHWNEYFYLPGYFVTPLYPGPHKALDVGISWDFFS